jgi:hypothetical protein
MTDQEPEARQKEKPAAGYRGELIYCQKDGCKIITMTVNLYSDERSHVYNLPLVEEAERCSASHPLAGVDVYRFPAIDGTNLMRTIESQEAKYTAVYSVGEIGIEEHSPFLWLDIMETHEVHKDLAQEPQTAQEWQVALDEALEYYKDEIPGWLEAQDRLDTTVHKPFHDHTIDFDR